ncbi:TPA: hypothetical protein HA273_04560 [Candidatus Bathyarchaeota archaeon]|nr:hypothetical protein [Candidatus Bathyarchaeota archaeon]HIJ07930.1 hypothetical protein [Candidatus Bathyarchaeota archaeon]
MSDRAKVFGIIIVLGFMAGVLAQLTATYIIPWLISVLPALAGLTSFMISGIAGACLTVVLVSAWAYLTSNRDR